MSAHLPKVLKSLDDTHDEALERLFELIRIPSVSTDPAYKPHCQQAADWCARQLAELGFDAKVVPTTGHPMVVAHDKVARSTAARTCCSTATTTCSRPTRWSCGRSPPFEPRIATDKANGKVIVARGAEDNKGQLMTFFEAVRAWKSVAGQLPDRHHRADRGRGGVRLAIAAGLPRQAWQGGDGRSGPRLRHRPVGQGHAGHLHAAARACRDRARHHRARAATCTRAATAALP